MEDSKTLTKAIKEELLIDLITGRPENEAVKIIANKFDRGFLKQGVWFAQKQRLFLGN